MNGAKKGLFGKGMQPGAMMPAYSMPQAGTMQDGANLGTPAQPKQGMDWKGALLQALGGAADGAATVFGGQPLIAQNRQFQQVQAMRQAEQERARSMDLADYRTKLGIQQEFAQPEAPKPGSFEWFETATPQQRALYDQYNPVTVATGQGPVAVPRSSLGGAPSAPVGRLTPIQPTTQNTPAPQLGANGMPTSVSRAQYQAIAAEMGAAETEAWARRNNIRVVN